MVNATCPEMTFLWFKMAGTAVVLQLLISLFFCCGLEAATVRIRAYNATGEVDITPYNFNTRVAITLGTRLLLTCDVTGLSDVTSEVVRYRWFHSLTGDTQGRYQIRDGDPYYRIVKDTVLVDVTSLDQGGKYYCFTIFSNAPGSSASTAILTVKGNPSPFLYTPTSLLPEHSVLTDEQQATGKNGQQWITCRSGGEGTRVEIWMGSELVVNNSTANSTTIDLGIQHPNGLYHCLSAQSQREYFSLFLRRSVTLAAPTVSGRDTSVWSLTTPDGSRVERYIVEFECRVRNITFVEKYMSVSASGGTGRVATSVSCFGGLGQLYRVKAWAVSGPNISLALVCVTNRQCLAEAATPQRINDTISGDPLYEVPIIVDEEGNKLFLCYEVQGQANQHFNLISDTCVSVNALYSPMINPSKGNIISKIGILAEDNNGTCQQIEADLEGCTARVNGAKLTMYNQSGIHVNRRTNRIRISVPNCETEDLVIWVVCEVHRGQPMIKFVVARGFNLRPTSHGLVGQFWNVEFKAEKYNVTAEDKLTPAPGHYAVTVNAPGKTRRFFAWKHSRTWDMEGVSCLYSGNVQGGPLYEVTSLSDPVIQGTYTDYTVSDLFDSEYKYVKFRPRCL